MAEQIPLVDYLVLGDDPYIVAHECTVRGPLLRASQRVCVVLRYRVSDRPGRRARGRCGPSPSWPRPPGDPGPVRGRVVDVDGTSVRANVVNVDPPEKVTLGMKVRLATFPVGTDEAGVEAVGFGYEPVG